jgi:uncharacterized protein
MGRRLSSIVKPPIGIEHLTERTRLFDMEFLDIESKHQSWFEAVNVAVFTAMVGHDITHDYAHIQRVVLKVHELYGSEKHHLWARGVDPLILIVAAMVHGIGGNTYAEEAATSENDLVVSRQKETRKQETQRDVTFKFLRVLGCPPAVAGPAALIASLVSVSRQIQQEDEIVGLAQAYPSLKLLQDADRLDSLGWVGITRAGSGSTIESVIRLIDEVLVGFPAKMNTRTARKEAERRWAQMAEFRDGVMGQLDCCGALRAP